MRWGFAKSKKHMKTRSLHQFEVVARGAGYTRPIHQSPGWVILACMHSTCRAKSSDPQLFVRRGHVLVANRSHLIMFGGKAWARLSLLWCHLPKAFLLVARRLIVGKRGGTPEKGALASSKRLSVHDRAFEQMEEDIPDLDYTPQSRSEYH